MAHAHSFVITLKNKKTEAEGIAFIQNKDPALIFPDAGTRKLLLDRLELDGRFRRAFDLVRIRGYDQGSIGREVAIDPAHITLIEVKCTKKRLPDSPRGFFFGATANEFDLAKRLGDRFRFCFICLHPECRSYRMLTLAELEPLIRTKRVQYQVNL